MSLLTVMLIVIRSESSLLKLSMLHANDRHGKAEQSCNKKKMYESQTNEIQFVELHFPP